VPPTHILKQHVPLRQAKRYYRLPSVFKNAVRNFWSEGRAAVNGADQFGDSPSRLLHAPTGSFSALRAISRRFVPSAVVPAEEHKVFRE